MALMVPTRNRVENALRLRKRFYETTSKTDIYFIVGTEDPRLDEYLERIPEVMVFPERGLVKALNFSARRLCYNYDALAFMGDDHLPRTSSWDISYLENLSRLRVGFCYGNDLLQGERIPTQVSMTSNIVKELGYFTPSCFTHLCCDLAWKDWGEGIDRLVYLDDVTIEHLHPAANKAQNDEGYAYANSSEMVLRDSEAYYNWKMNDLPGEIQRLKILRDLLDTEHRTL
jgi:hypothetical protein